MFARATAHLADSLADWAYTIAVMLATQLLADRAHTIVVMLAAQLLADRANTIAVVVAAQPLADRTNAMTIVVAPKLKIAHRQKLTMEIQFHPNTKKREVANRWICDRSVGNGWLNAACRWMIVCVIAILHQSSPPHVEQASKAAAGAGASA
jgi:hypothetical protein